MGCRSASNPLYLVLLDAFHLDDLLFLGSLGRLMAAAPRPVVLVHGDGGLAAYRARASEAVLGERWRDLIEQLVAR